MKRVERTARISAPPDQVFAFIADLDNLASWMTGVVSVDAGPGQVGVGSTARIVRELMGSRVEAPLTVTAYDPPARLAIDSEVSGVRAGAELQLSADETSTVLRFAMEIRGSGMTRFMEPMIASAAGGEIDESIRRIQQRFAGASPS